MFGRLRPCDYEWAWCGRERKCPKCKTRFRSQYDRGQCTQCRHVFDASRVHGIPAGVTKKEILETLAVKEKERREDLLATALALPLEKVEGFPIEKSPPATRDPRQWKRDRRSLWEAVRNGAELYRWRRPGRFHSSIGYVAISNGEGVFAMSTSSGRWTPVEFPFTLSEMKEGIENAIQDGDVARVRSLVEDGGDPNAVAKTVAFCYGDSQVTLLHVAAECGQLDVVKPLIELGARPDVKFTTGETPWTLATLEGHKDVADYLRELMERADG